MLIHNYVIKKNNVLLLIAVGKRFFSDNEVLQQVWADKEKDDKEKAEKEKGKVLIECVH